MSSLKTRTRHVEETVARVLSQCARDIHAVLSVYYNLRPNIHDCVRKRYSCSELLAMDRFSDRGRIRIDANNVDAFVDFALRGYRVGLNTAKIGPADQALIQNLKSLANIVRQKMESVALSETQVAARSPSSSCAVADEGGLSADQTRQYELKTLAYLERKKAMQDGYITDWAHVKQFTADQLIAEKRKIPELDNRLRQSFERLETNTKAEVEREKRLAAEHRRNFEVEEDELRKVRETDENTLSSLIERYDTEIPELRTIRDELLAKKTYYEHHLGLLVTRVNQQKSQLKQVAVTELQWELEAFEGQLFQLKDTIAERFLLLFLAAYVTFWRQQEATKNKL